MSDTKKEQIDLAAELQLLWLKRMKKLFEDGTITSTDMATLARVLMQNGWTIDPHQLPQSLKDKMKKSDPTVFDDDDADVVGKIA